MDKQGLFIWLLPFSLPCIHIFSPIIIQPIKVLLNHNTAKYNMWFHLIGRSYFPHVHVKMSSSTKDDHDKLKIYHLFALTHLRQHISHATHPVLWKAYSYIIMVRTRRNVSLWRNSASWWTERVVHPVSQNVVSCCLHWSVSFCDNLEISKSNIFISSVAVWCG